MCAEDPTSLLATRTILKSEILDTKNIKNILFYVGGKNYSITMLPKITKFPKRRKINELKQ